MESGSKRPTYKWSSFAVAASLVFVVVACFAWRDYVLHGSVDPLFPFGAFWMVAFLAISGAACEPNWRGEYSPSRSTTSIQ
jgi:hypothetical protein